MRRIFSFRSDIIVILVRRASRDDLRDCQVRMVSWEGGNELLGEGESDGGRGPVGVPGGALRQESIVVSTSAAKSRTRKHYVN